jgi:hypothetical protein
MLYKQFVNISNPANMLDVVAATMTRFFNENANKANQEFCQARHAKCSRIEADTILNQVACEAELHCSQNHRALNMSFAKCRAVLEGVTTGMQSVTSELNRFHENKTQIPCLLFANSILRSDAKCFAEGWTSIVRPCSEKCSKIWAQNNVEWPTCNIVFTRSLFKAFNFNSWDDLHDRQFPLRFDAWRGVCNQETVNELFSFQV